MIELMKQLCALPGPSGCEEDVYKRQHLHESCRLLIGLHRQGGVLFYLFNVIKIDILGGELRMKRLCKVGAVSYTHLYMLRLFVNFLRKFY